MGIDTNDRPSIIIPLPLIFCVFLGAGFLLDYLFPIKLFRLAWWPRIICGGLIIEEYLEQKFGGSYLNYRAKVRRWL